MADLLENINKHLSYSKAPKVNDYVKHTEQIMDITIKMEKYLNNITDDRKRETMKKNISMVQSILIDNLTMFNEWVEKETQEGK